MNIQIEKLPKSKVRIKFEVPAEMVDQYIEKAYQDKAKAVTIPGFRPGHAPRHMVEAKVGTSEIHNKALELLFPFAYAEAITQEKIMAVGRPNVKVNKFAPGNPAEFEAEVSILPEVTLGNYKNLVVKKEKIKIEKEDIDKVLENLRKREAELEAKEGPIEQGDWAEINFSGTKEGVVLEKLCSQNHPFVVGEGTLLPDFEKNVIGLKQGEEKSFDLIFPGDYNDKDLCGQKVTFTVTANKIQKVNLPELGDEFAKKISGSQDKNIDDLRADIEKALLSQREQEDRIRLEEEIITQVTEQAKVDIPEELIDQERAQLKEGFSQKLEAQGLNLERYLEFIKKKTEDFDEELRKEAERKIKVGLVLNKIAEEEGIEVTEEEREAEVKRYQAKDSTTKDKDSEMKEDEMRRYVTIILKHRKAIEKLLEYSGN